MDLKKIAVENLKDFKTIVDELNITYWLDGGTLLGAYRDNDFPPGDENDIDIGCWINYDFLIPTIIEKCKEKGFEVYKIWKRQIVVKRGGSKIDLFFHDKQGMDVYHFLYRRTTINTTAKIVEIDKLENGDFYWECIPAVVPAHFFERLTVIDFHGMVFNCPRDLKNYFLYKYGPDWETPITQKEYFARGGCYDSKTNRVIRPDYVIKN